MILGLTHSENQSLQAVFPEQCLRVTPDPEFLSNLYDFDISMCPHRPWQVHTSRITLIFMAIFDARWASSRVPALFVWMQAQVRQTIITLFAFY